MELASLGQYQSFFPFPSTMTAYMLHIAVPGADDTCQRAWWSILMQIGHEETWENLDQVINGRDKFTFNAPKSLCMLYPPQTHQYPKASTMHKDSVWTRLWTEYRGEDGISRALSERDIVEVWDWQSFGISYDIN